MDSLHSTNSHPAWKGTQSKPKPTELNPKHLKNLNKPVEIARGGRVSNPVPGRAGLKTGRVPEIADDRRT